MEDSVRASTMVDSSETIPLAEEVLHVDKRETVTGRVRVRTVTETRDELARAELSRESVEVTRVPVDRMVDVAPEIRQEGDVTIIPVIEEVLVVEKRLVVREELHVRRTRHTETIEEAVPVRRQDVIVERVEPDAAESA
jgi:stress response protein YsnF